VGRPIRARASCGWSIRPHAACWCSGWELTSPLLPGFRLAVDALFADLE